MNESERQEMIALFNATLDGRDRIDAVTHKVHHDQYAADLDERKIKRERWETIRRQVMGWGIIVALTTIGTAAYKLFFRH